MGNKINEFRKEKNMSVESFAKALGYSVSAVAKILYGEREPGKNFFKKLKKKFPETDMNLFFED